MKSLKGKRVLAGNWSEKRDQNQKPFIMSYAPIRTETSHKDPNCSQSSILPQNSLSRSPRWKHRRSSRIPGHHRSVAGGAPLIVHCHLCWDWVWQRPQQFVSRLSQQHRTLFVETVAPDPELAVASARFRPVDQFPNITLLRLQFPAWRWSDATYVDEERRRLVQEFLAGPGAGEFENPIQWFYDPMAAPAFAGQMGEILTVYDCMDELSKFHCAPPEMSKREAELLRCADIVFTGGRRLFEAKSRFHDNCHFHGCGVDCDHFGQALMESTLVPKELEQLKKPVLGFFGVVDERMDYELIARLADENKEWTIVLIGPATKVNEQSLPQRNNIQWLGQRPYGELPAWCKGFDVCLMPFALNAATEFINPTKALEYMATGRPIVSTAIPDVVRNFGSIVKIAAGQDEFISHCRAALTAPDAKAVAAGLELARENSWESIVVQLEQHMKDALQHRPQPRVTT